MADPRPLKERLKGWRIGDIEATQEARRLPGGLGNMDELTEHGPGFVGMSLRLYNARTRKWNIYWARNRVDGLEPPVVGCSTTGSASSRAVSSSTGGGSRAVHLVEHHEDGAR